MAPASSTASRWLYGPAPDLLLGCGLWYAGAFAVFLAAGPALRQAQPPWLMPLLILLVSTPHYGATLIRAYRRREDRRAYAVFTVGATLLLCGWFVAGVYDAALGTLMVTTYLTWSPWHYTGQNYGIAVMFVRRRGIEPSPSTKRWLYASFALSFALTFLVMHRAGPVAPDAGAAFRGAGIRFEPLGIPEAIASVAVPGVAIAYLVALAGAALQLRRLGSSRDLLPVGALCLTQALWFSVPQAARHWNASAGLEVLDFEYRATWFSWVVLAHAVQYLWVTSYYAKASTGWSSQPRYLAQAVLVGNAAWMVPALVFAPDVFGRLSFDLGLGFLVAALVNLHHFVLDGAIWKLRHSRIAGVLIRSESDPARADAPARAGARRAIALAWAGAAVLLAVGLADLWETQIQLPAAMQRGDAEAVRASLRRAAWIGKDSAYTRLVVGDGLARAGRVDEAMDEYARSLELQPGVGAHHATALLYARQGRWPEALRHLERALAIDPSHPELLARTGLAHLELGQPERARAYLERAIGADPDSQLARQGLARLDAARGGRLGGPD